MTVQNKYFTTTVVASNDFRTAHLDKAVTAGGLVAAAPGTAMGLLKSKPNVGEHATLGYLGEMAYVAGAAVTINATLTVTTSGFIIPYTGVASGGTLPIGRALEAANSGDLARGLFNFANGA